MTAGIMYYGGGGVTGDPQYAMDYYRLMQGLWKDGEPITAFGQSGYQTEGDTTTYFFPGNPETGSFWSELNIDQQGTPNIASDRRGAASSGPFDLEPGDSAEFLIAYLWARGDSYLDSVRLLKDYTSRVRNAGDALLAPGFNPDGYIRLPEPAYLLGFADNYPNPFSDQTTLRYQIPQSMYVRLAIYDMLGKQVALLTDGTQERGTYSINFEAGSLPSGIYMARIQFDHRSFTRKMVLVR